MPSVAKDLFSLDLPRRTYRLKCLRLEELPCARRCQKAVGLSDPNICHVNADIQAWTLSVAPQLSTCPPVCMDKGRKTESTCPSSELRAAHLPRARRWAPAHRWCRHRLADGLHTTQWPPWGRRRSWDRRRGPTQSKGSRRGKQVVLSHVSRTRSVVNRGSAAVLDFPKEGPPCP